MKSSRNPLCCLALVSIFSFCFSIQSFTQEKVIISAGAGLPDFLNATVRYQFKQAQIGIGMGFVPIKDESVITVSGTFYYHFAGASDFTTRYPWYGRIGLDYLRDETETIIDKYLYLDLRMGRDFNISKKFGIQLDAGILFQLYNETIDKEPSGVWNFEFYFPVLPGIGVGFFYRI